MPLGPFTKQTAGTDVAYARAGNCTSQNGALVIQCQLDPVAVKITDIHGQSVFTTETIRGRPVGRWSSGRLAGWRYIRPTHVMTRSVRTSCQNQCSAHRKHQCRHFHRQTPFVKKHKNALLTAVPFSEQRDNTRGQQEQGVNHRDCARLITRWQAGAARHKASITQCRRCPTSPAHRRRAYQFIQIPKVKPCQNVCRKSP